MTSYLRCSNILLQKAVTELQKERGIIMNKAELIERIIDTFTDMGSEDPEDTAYANPLTLAEAEMYLKEIRATEKIDLEPDEWLPSEVTPDLYMEAHNCYLRKCKHDVTAQRLAEFFRLNEMVDVYHEFDGDYHSDKDKYVCPTDWLTENMEFPFTSFDFTMLDLIQLGQHSPDFDPDKKYCWYEIKDNNPECVRNELHSTDTPFADGLIDATAFAEWILESPGRIWYVKDYCMINTDIDYIFRYWQTETEEE